jgi:hypothetical protein
LIMALTVPPNITKGAAKFGWDKGVDLSSPGIGAAFTPGSGATPGGFPAPEGPQSDLATLTNYLTQARREDRAANTLERAEEEARQLRQAKERQALAKESLGIASMYSHVNKLPDKIASAFGGAGDLQLMLGTYGNIPAIVSETYRTFPQRTIQPVGSAAPSTQYFGRG